jgi:hypothetical protein
MAPAVAPPPVAGSVKSTGAQLVAAFPPRPVAASWPATGARRSAVLDRVLAAPFALDNPNSQRNRRLGVLAVLGWLRTQPGDNWQQRWRASGAEDQPDWRLLVGADRANPLPHLTSGLLVLICAEVIRPGLDWLLRFAPARHNLAAEMARTRDRGAFAELTALCQGRVGQQSQQQALTNIAIIMAVKGGNVAAVRVGDCLELLATAARTRATADRHAHSPLFYQLLRAHGDLGPDAPAAIEMFSGRGQPSCEQLIDRYRIACRPVRDVLVDYLRERQPAVDFSTLQRLAYLLGKLFWADLEAHHPGIDSLQLPRDVAAAWKQRAHPPAGHQAPRPAHRAAAGRAQRAHRGAGLLPRPGRVGRRRSRPLGAVGGPVSGQRQRRLPQEGPPAPQVPHGHPHPRTAAGAADAGLLGGGRTHPHRRAARRRRAHPARRGVHRRRHDPAPGGAKDPDHRARLGRAPRHRPAP